MPLPGRAEAVELFPSEIDSKAIWIGAGGGNVVQAQDSADRNEGPLLAPDGNNRRPGRSTGLGARGRVFKDDTIRDLDPKIPCRCQVRLRVGLPELHVFCRDDYGRSWDPGTDPKPVEMGIHEDAIAIEQHRSAQELHANRP